MSRINIHDLDLDFSNPDEIDGYFDSFASRQKIKKRRNKSWVQESMEKRYRRSFKQRRKASKQHYDNNGIYDAD